MAAPELPDFARRIFLHRSLQALAALAVVPVNNLVLAGTANSESGAALATVFLSPAELAILDRVADTLIPSGGAFDIGAADVKLAQRIDRYLPKLDPRVSTGFRGALAFIEQKAPAMAEKPAPFTQLGASDRTAVLEAMLKAGGLPEGIFLGLKYVAMGHFYTMDVTWQYTGYDGPMLLEKAK